MKSHPEYLSRPHQPGRKPRLMDFVFKKEKEADRIVVITDEQDCSG